MVGEPESCEEVLRNNHTQSYHYGVGDAQLVIAAQAIATEDGAADDGLQQIVSEAHASKDAQVMEHIPNALEGIPRRDHSRDYHQEDDKVVDGFEPHAKFTKVHETQGYDNSGR